MQAINPAVIVKIIGVTASPHPCCEAPAPAFRAGAGHQRRVNGARPGLRHPGGCGGRAGTGRHQPALFRPFPRSVLGMLGSSTGPSLPHAVKTSTMAISGAPMVRNERVRWTVVLVICLSVLIEVCLVWTHRPSTSRGLWRAVSCLAIRPDVPAALSPECVGDAGFFNGAVASARRQDKRYGDQRSGDGPQRTGALDSCSGHLFFRLN